MYPYQCVYAYQCVPIPPYQCVPIPVCTHTSVYCEHTFMETPIFHRFYGPFWLLCITLIIVLATVFCIMKRRVRHAISIDKSLVIFDVDYAETNHLCRLWNIRASMTPPWKYRRWVVMKCILNHIVTVRSYTQCPWVFSYHSSESWCIYIAVQYPQYKALLNDTV